MSAPVKMDRVTAAALRDLARHVLALADGMGGDEQEQARARDIADALEFIADDAPMLMVLPDHETARREFFERADEEVLS